MTKTKYPKNTTVTDYRKFGYVVVKPSSMPSGTVPIVIVGHGQGECGDGTSTQLDRVSNWGGFKGLQLSVDLFKIVLIHLQTSSRYQYGEIQAGLAFAKTFGFCDVNDIHYYGVSLGGYGFFQQSAASSTFPANFATITLAAPGPGNSDLTGDNIGKSGRPLWILHGHNDCIVSVSNSQNVINDVIAHGGSGRTWISIWKDRTGCTPGANCATQCAHDMVSFIVGESWNTSNTVNTAYNILPTYPLNSNRGIREISGGTLAKMGFHQFVKSNKKGASIIPPTNTYNSGPVTNTAPVANAGSDKNITLPVSSVTVTGITSTDATPPISSYRWSKVSGPTTFNIQSPSSISTVISNLVEGTYVFRLTVTDSGGLSDTDDVTVIVNPEPIQPPPPNAGPTARAGVDQTITLPVDSVVLTGVTSSDPDGNPLTYQWTKISGPQATIVSPTSGETVVSGLAEGTYVFRLTVTDTGDLSDIDEVNIIVNPAPVTKTLLVTFKVYSDGSVEKI